MKKLLEAEGFCADPNDECTPGEYLIIEIMLKYQQSF